MKTYVEKPKTLAELRAGIAAGRVKAADLAGQLLRPHCGDQSAAECLSEPDQRARAGAGGACRCAAAKGDPLAPLAGIPVGIKDVLVMRGAPATAGSKILKGYQPPYDATAVAQARSGGRGAAGQAELRRVCHGLVE